MTAFEQSTFNSKSMGPDYYISRELSWLEFNRRVLHEATDERVPLLERLKFLAIFSANLDEFFMVRVAALKQQIEVGVSRPAPDGLAPIEHLEAIGQTLRPMVDEHNAIFITKIRPKLAQVGIHLVDYEELTATQEAYLQEYFEEQLFPVLTPLAVDPGHPFPYISNLSLNLAVVVRDPKTNQDHFARIKVPRVLPRFVPLPITNSAPVSESAVVEEARSWIQVPLEQVIAHNLKFLFPGMQVESYYLFRVTRNADLTVEEDEADDLMLAIEQGLRQRRLGGSAVRLEIQQDAPPALRAMLMQEMGLDNADVYDISGLLGLGDLMTFLSLPLPEFKDNPWTPIVPGAFAELGRPNISEGNTELEDAEDLFALLRSKDHLLHHPYHSFTATVQRFITQAAHDPGVLAIKMTLYRTSGDSPIVKALISAAENGKQVVVLVEIKARFDEENNINWARKLEKSGVHVVYGLVGLKTHTKVILVVRQERNHIRRYFHIGTGNYNPKTARLYTDLGLLSSRADIGADITDLFNFLTGFSRQERYRKLLVAPVNLRGHITKLIHQEIEQANQGNSAHIIAKMNSLVDPDIISTLYIASQAGVKVDLIVRGICCLRPGIPGISENIHVISIVGRFLEHSRIFYFQNGGNESFLVGSADWMPRNLDRRVEAVVPVEDPNIKEELREILNIALADNRQAWDMQPDGSYCQRRPKRGQPSLSSQKVLMERALKQGA